MWISDFSIRNPVVTIVAMLALMVFGVFSLFTLDTDEFPEVNPPVIAVAIPYPGASPEVVERELIDPMEEAFASISGLDDINSTATDGYCVITVIFDFEKDLKEAAQDIRDRISEIRRDLPPEIEEPTLTRFDPNDLPIVSLTLSSAGMSSPELTALADPGLTGDLRSIPGVADVNVVGGVERELTVELNPQALQAAGIGVSQVVQALQVQNLASPVGRLTSDFEERTIRLKGRLEKPSDFEQLVISQSGGQVIRLGQVASVRDGAEEPRSLAFFNGEQAVGIDIKKATNASTTAVSEHIRAKVSEIQKSLPAGVSLEVVRDSGVRVEDSVQEVQDSLIEGALLTVLVVFLFLTSWRSTIITGLALPVSVMASFIAVKSFGFTLNTMSLLGLSLSIGILIDDAIVVRENIVRHMEMGKDHVTAAREGTAEIGLAVAATTFSIVVVFVPIAFMGGMSEQWFAPFALTIAASVLVSLFVSFSLDPMLSASWADPDIETSTRSGVARFLGHFNTWLERQTGRYKKVIGWALRHPFAMAFIAAGSFVGALAMPAVGLIGSSFFPDQDRSEFTISLETPPGSSLEYMRRKTLEVIAIAREWPEVTYTYATIGGESGAVDAADIYVRLTPKSSRKRGQAEISDGVRERIQRIGGATAALSSGGFGNFKQVQVQLTGPDSRVLSTLAEQLALEVGKVEGAVDVGLSTKGQKPEIEVSLDRDLAGTMGLSIGQIAQALRPAFAGLDSGDWIDPTGKTRDVMVRLAPEARVSPTDLESLPMTVPGPNGQMSTMPLGQVAHVTQGVGPALINHLNRQRVVTIGANTRGRPLNQVVADIETRLASVALPPGYKVKQGGETEDQQEVFTRIMMALGVAVMLMYMILVMQFGSFLDPIAIMASLPLSLIGVMLGLLVTGSTLNLMSMIGVILLMGIVAKNAILLIDFAKWSQEKGMTRKEAIIEAGGVRLRPILMTSLAVIAGMLPVALGLGEGGDFRAPLGRAVIGGVITSTLLTLLVIPTFYDTISGWRDSLSARFRGKKHGHHKPAPPHEALPADVRPG